MLFLISEVPLYGAHHLTEKPMTGAASSSTRLSQTLLSGPGAIRRCAFPEKMSAPAKCPPIRVFGKRVSTHRPSTRRKQSPAFYSLVTRCAFPENMTAPAKCPPIRVIGKRVSVEHKK